MSSTGTVLGLLRVIAPSANKGTLRRSFHNSRPNATVFPKADRKTFDKVLKESSGRVVLVDFYADWCRPCHMLSPILEKYSSENNTFTNGVPVDLIKIDTDSKDGQALAQEHEVHALPTVFVYKDGEAVTHFKGVLPEAQVKQILDSM
ncbi:hypothetical protein Ac2012v2_002086 [Leucoagaricus gongylophorus]